MGWAEFEFHSVPETYKEGLERLDEELVRLWTERRRLSDGRVYTPPREMLETWSERYGVELAQLQWWIRAVQLEERPVMHESPGELVGVLPIMMRTEAHGFEYRMTHAMQHTDSSVVHVEVRQLEGPPAGLLRISLMLEVEGNREYRIFRNGHRGGGGQASLQYRVTPPLPESLEGIRFRLIPFANPMEDRRLEIHLDREVRFGE
ncbi:hypothetical protein [Gorillibacterium sp. sgz5001074]|uniref:hypothetical protein n=1 Tax=Gorillibacterium sp. sgz5001074 TaxID=3446695 RepID=UPI003F661A0E